jgi:hypothetical protein
MTSDRLHHVRTWHVRIAFAVLVTTVLAAGSPVIAADTLAGGGGGATTMGCQGRCM